MDPVKLAMLAVGLGAFLVVGGMIVMFIIDSGETRTSEQIAADDAAWKAAKKERRAARKAAKRWQPEVVETAPDLVK
jgi:hypothetical protein